MKRTLKTAIAALAENLEKTESLKNSIQEQLTALKEQRERIEKFVLESTEDRLESVPEIVANLAPFVAFSATPKTIGSCIQAAVQIKKELVPSLENTIKSEVDGLKASLDLLEGYGLQELERSKTTSQKGFNGYRIESRTQVRYTVSDKTLFLKQIAELGALSEVTVSVPQNSVKMAKLIEELEDLPQGLTQNRRKVACFVKG